MRRAVIDRRTTETQIVVRLGLEGQGRYAIRTGIRFLDHMLELFARHGGFDLRIEATGDLDVDQHHTVEDLGIALGEAVSQALGNRRGINRAGYFVMPMDETLAVAAIDLGGRPHTVVDLKVKVRRVGDLQTELVHDFFEGFAIGARANVHVKVLYGRSSHHKIEAVFKAFARALRVACAKDKRLARMLPSTKGLSVIALIDYKAGNLTSVRKALRRHRRRAVRPRRAGRSRRRPTASSCRASVTSARPARSIADGSRRSAARRRRPAAARHLPRHAVAVRRQRRSADCPGLGTAARPCYR